jgi:hypothetical protein
VNGFYYKEGELQKEAIKKFKAPQYINSLIQKYGKYATTWIYKIRHFRGDQEIIHGFIITRENPESGLQECVFRTYPNTQKSEWCIEQSLKKILESSEKSSKAKQNFISKVKKNACDILNGEKIWKDLNEFEKGPLRKLEGFNFPPEPKHITIWKEGDEVTKAYNLPEGYTLEVMDFDRHQDGNRHENGRGRKYSLHIIENKEQPLPVPSKEEPESKAWSPICFNPNRPQSTTLEEIEQFLDKGVHDDRQIELIRQILLQKFHQECNQALIHESPLRKSRAKETAMLLIRAGGEAPKIPEYSKI